MVHVRGLVQLAAVAVALCAATSVSAEQAPRRALQFSFDGTDDSESPAPPAVSPITLPFTLPNLLPTPSTAPPAPTDAPGSPSPPTPSSATPPSPPTPTTTAPTTTRPRPTTTAPPSTTAPPTLLPTILPTILPPLTTAPPSTTAPPTEPPSTTAPPTTTEPPSTTAPPTEPPSTTAPPLTTAPPSTTAPPTILPTILPTLLPPVTTQPPSTSEPPSTTAPPTVLPPVTLTPEPGTGSPSPPPPPPPTPTTPEPGTGSPPPPPPPTPTTPEPGTGSPSPPPPPPPTPTTPEPGTGSPSPPPPPPPTPTTPEPGTGSPSPPPPPPPTPTTPEPGTGSPSPPPPTTPTPSTADPSVPTTRPPTSAPPLVVIDIPTELPDTPAPSSTKKTDPTPEPEVNSQANKKDIITANSTDEAEAPTANPFQITVVSSESPKPVVLNIGDDGSKTDAPKLYVRGDKTTQPPAVDSSSSVANDQPAAPSPNVIGGSRRNTVTAAESILTPTSQSFHDFLRYAAAAFSGISVALLLFFHFVSLDATLTWTSSLWSPNTWEFILYVSYLQQMASVSQLTLLKTPYYLWDYSDSFAWTNFLIQRSTSPDGRRLETIVLGGVVAYADRIGVDETKIVYHAVVGFAVVLAALLVLFLIIAVFAKRKAEQAMDDPSHLHNSTQSVHALRSASIRTLGLCVLIWYFALYPLSLYASFEISMEVQAKAAVASALIVSILAIGGVCFGVLAWSGRVIMQKSKEELLQFENMATWGSLYAEFSFRSRMFFIVGALVQIVTGIIVGTMDSDPTQLIVVIIVEVLYLLAVFVLSPFAELLVLRFTYALGLLKIINFSLAFAFLNSNGMSGSGRNSVANTFIGINTIVIIAWFIRQLIVFSTYIRAWAVRTSFIEETENAQEDGAAKYETRTATDSDVYASVSTARHGEGGPSIDTDDFHRAPPPREMRY